MSDVNVPLSAVCLSVSLVSSITGPILWGHSGPLSRNVVVVVVVVVVVDIDAQAACDSGGMRQ